MTMSADPETVWITASAHTTVYHTRRGCGRGEFSRRFAYSPRPPASQSARPAG